MKNERIWILDIMAYGNCDAITNSNYQQETWDYKTVLQHYWKKDWMVDKKVRNIRQRCKTKKAVKKPKNIYFSMYSNYWKGKCENGSWFLVKSQAA